MDSTKSAVGTLGTTIIKPMLSANNSTTTNQKIVIASVSIGVALIGILANFLRRPRRLLLDGSKTTTSSLGGGGAGRSVDFVDGPHSKNHFMIPNGTGSPSRGGGGRSSIASSRYTDTTLVSNSINDNITQNILGTQNLNCTQLGVLGLESVEKSITYFESALGVLKGEIDESGGGGDREASILPSVQESTVNHLERILDAAYNLQRLTEELFLHEGSILYADSEHERGAGCSYRLRSVSSMDSFLSAEDFLSDDEDIQQSLINAGFEGDLSLSGAGASSSSVPFPLYEAGLRLVEAGTVPYRTLKTEMVGCKYGDKEYLAKLHCLRGAFSRIVSDPEKKTWIWKNGKEVLMEIMIRAEKDPSDFEQSFDTFVAWAQEPSNWALTETELKDRGLRALTFYDIVLDFIFLDAFEDLEAPPASVLAVTQNRWLSNSFKETALSTAVWSVLKTKRRWLRYNDGFVAHFYDLSETIMPTLAWGFLGPPTPLQELCIFFKEKFQDFLKSIFSFDKVRYTSLDNLAEDVMEQMDEMHRVVMERLSSAAGGAVDE